jgi:hypothetical protein
MSSKVVESLSVYAAYVRGENGDNPGGSNVSTVTNANL